MRAFLVLVLMAWMSAAPAHADAIDDLVRVEMAKRHIPGVALGIAENGKPLKVAVYGAANLENQVPVRTDTSFELFSLTKTFTAAGVMRLVERGQLKLDDAVSSKLPGLPTSWSGITIRDCLTHTSGLPDIIDADEQLRASDWDTAVGILARLPARPPREGAMYNQTGYVLLRLVVQKVTGKPLEEFLREEFFAPLAMKATRFADSRDIITDRASWYTTLEPSADRKTFLVRDGKPAISQSLYANYSFFPPLMHGSAGLVTTIADLMKWEQALAGGRILSKSALAATLKVPLLKDGSTGPFGLGWATATLDGHRFMTFGGGNSVVYLRFPDDGLSVMLLTNLQGADPNTIAVGIARKLFGSPPGRGVVSESP